MTDAPLAAERQNRSVEKPMARKPVLKQFGDLT